TRRASSASSPRSTRRAVRTTIPPAPAKSQSFLSPNRQIAISRENGGGGNRTRARFQSTRRTNREDEAGPPHQRVSGVLVAGETVGLPLLQTVDCVPAQGGTMPRLYTVAAMIAAIGVVAAPAPATPGDSTPYSLAAVALLGTNGT